jgi:hypothetical protein
MATFPLALPPSQKGRPAGASTFACASLAFEVLLTTAPGCRMDHAGLVASPKQQAPASVEAAPDTRPAADDAAPADGGLEAADDGPAADAVEAGEDLAVDAAAEGEAGDGSEPIGADGGDLAVQVLPELGSGLVLWLPLDESTGAIGASDESGENNRVTLRNAGPGLAWVAGRIGGALDLGTTAPGGAHLRVESSPSLNRIGNELSITAWLWRTSGQPGLIVSRRATAANGVLYRLSIEPDGRLRLLLNDRRGVRLELHSTVGLPTGSWVHAAVACDRRSARLYVDGNPAGEAAYGVPFAPDVSPLLIGAGSDVAGFLSERLDEVLLYSRALAATEVTALASGARPPGADERP